MSVSEAWAALTARIGARGLPFREFVVDANDGIIATAGVVEGFAGAGAGRTAVLIAGLSAMLAGAIALGGVKYAEAAAERDEALAMIAEERRQLALAPEEETAELAAYYMAKGLSPDLAMQVADQLTRRDAVAAHVEAEHGVDVSNVVRPTPVAALAGTAFVVGAAIPLMAAVLAEDSRRSVVTFFAVIVSLVLTSTVQAKAGHMGVGRTVLRTVLIGVTAMLVTYAVGVAFQP